MYNLIKHDHSTEPYLILISVMLLIVSISQQYVYLHINFQERWVVTQKLNKLKEYAIYVRVNTLETRLRLANPTKYFLSSLCKVNIIFKQVDKQNLFIYIFNMKDTSIANLTNIYLYKIEKNI